MNASFQQPPKQLPSRDKLLAGTGQGPALTVRLERHRHRRRTPRRPAAAWCSATRTSRGAAATGSPQLQLTIPGTYDVAGASLIGSPVVNIGWNKDVAWSHTVSTAYRFTPYEYQTVPGTGTTYLTDQRAQAARRSAPCRSPCKQRQRVGRRTVTRHLYRTDQGYVLDDPDDADELDARPASSRCVTPTASSCAPIDTFLDMGKATSARDLLARQDKARRDAVGEHHRRRPQRRRAVRRPLGRPERLQRPGAAVHDTRRPGAVPGGRPAGARRHARRRGLRLGHRQRRPAARHLRAEEPARRRTARLGDERQRLLLAAQPGARSSRASPGSSAARSASGRCAPGWSTATSSTRSKAGKVRPGEAPRLPAREPGAAAPR